MDRMSMRMAALTGASLIAVAGPRYAAADQPALATAPVAAVAVQRATGYDGVVEAVRHTVVSAQVAGAVVALPIKAGDRVKAGQLLVRLDARAAEHQAGAADAQAQAAQAVQEVAAKEFERQRQLFHRNYISQAALDAAEAQLKSAQAQAAAQSAAARAARTESGFYVLRAPYDGVVSDVSVVLGDTAMPGRPLLAVYDPAALRIAAVVPQTAAPPAHGALRADVPGTAEIGLVPVRWRQLPALDPATHTVQLQLDLPRGTTAVPGMFARVWITASESTDGPVRLQVPRSAVLRRAELTGVYVISDDGRPLLRQVRLGPINGDHVEVLAGLAANERVALDPQAAARAR